MDVHAVVAGEDVLEAHGEVEVKGTEKGQDPVGMEQEDELVMSELED